MGEQIFNQFLKEKKNMDQNLNLSVRLNWNMVSILKLIGKETTSCACMEYGTNKESKMYKIAKMNVTHVRFHSLRFQKIMFSNITLNHTSNFPSEVKVANNHFHPIFLIWRAMHKFVISYI